MEYLIIIPARGGSKGIKNKNIIPISDKPLISYSILIANKLKEAGFIKHAIVSTDSEEIKKVSENYGIDVPFLRPPELSGDKAKSIDYILHAISFYEDQYVYFDAVIILQPTSPLRTYDDVKESISIFNTSNNDSLISVYQEDYINDMVSYNSKDGKLIPHNKLHNKGMRRQDQLYPYIRNGAVYITKTSYLKSKNEIVSDYPSYYLMPKSRSVNLDTEEDLILLKSLIKKYENSNS